MGYLFIAPALIFLYFMTIYPMGKVIYDSLFDYSMGYKGGHFIGIVNYISLFKDKLLLTSLKNTIIFSLGAVIFHLILGLFLAILLNQHFNKKNNFLQNLFRGAFLMPWLFSSAVAAAIWALMFNPFGILNYALSKFGLGPISFLGDSTIAMWSVIWVDVWKFFPFSMVMILAGLQSIPIELYEASTIDGASRMGQFRYVTLPLLTPVIIVITTLDFIWSFGFFDMIWLLTRGGPMDATEVLATYNYKTAFLGLKFGYASSISVVIFIILLILSLIYLRIYRKSSEGRVV